MCVCVKKKKNVFGTYIDHWRIEHGAPARFTSSTSTQSVENGHTKKHKILKGVSSSSVESKNVKKATGSSKTSKSSKNKKFSWEDFKKKVKR